MNVKWGSRWLSTFFPINLAQGGSWPLIPLVILSLGGNVADISVTMFVYYGSTILSSKMWGRLSDRLAKRKIFIITSFFSSSVFYLIFSLLRSIPQIILVSFILGFFLTAYPPSAIMLIVESHKKSEWTPYISSYNLFSGFGWSTGLVLGAIWVNYYPLSSFFMVCSFVSFLGGIAALFFIREPAITLEREALPLVTFSLIERKIHNFMHLPRSLELKRFIKTVKAKYVSDLSIYYGSLLIFFTASNAFFTQLPAYFREIPITDSTIFILLGIHQLTATLTFIRAGSLITKLGEKSVTTAGIAVRVIVFTLFLLFSLLLRSIQFNLLILLPMLFLTGISWALFWTPTVSLLSKIVSTAHVGEAQGNLNSIVGLGTVIGSLISGYLILLLGFSLNFLFAAVSMLVGWIIFSKSGILKAVS